MIPDPNSKEPALFISALFTTLISAAVLANTYLFPDLLNENQEHAIAAVGTVLLPMIIGLITRHYVWSPASVAKIIASKKEDSPPIDPNKWFDNS